MPPQNLLITITFKLHPVTFTSREDLVKCFSAVMHHLIFDINEQLQFCLRPPSYAESWSEGLSGEPAAHRVTDVRTNVIQLGSIFCTHRTPGKQKRHSHTSRAIHLKSKQHQTSSCCLSNSVHMPSSILLSLYGPEQSWLWTSYKKHCLVLKGSIQQVKKIN